MADLTPTWTGSLRFLLDVYATGATEAKNAVIKDLMKPLALVDKLNGKTITVDGEPFDPEGKENDNEG